MLISDSKLNSASLFLKKKLKIGSAVSEMSLIKQCKKHKRFFEKKFFFNFFKNLKTPKISENIDSGLIFMQNSKIRPDVSKHPAFLQGCLILPQEMLKKPKFSSWLALL